MATIRQGGEAIIVLSGDRILTLFKGYLLKSIYYRQYLGTWSHSDQNSLTVILYDQRN